MNCLECRELLVGYIEELLDAGQNEAVKSHLDTCAECRKELEQVTSLQKRLVANGASHGQNDLENAVMDRIVREQALKLREANQGKQNANFWRLILRSPITKLAAAAVIIIAVFAGIYFITGKPPAVTCCAWARIADRVEQTKSCVCSVQISRLDKNAGQPEQQIGVRLYLSSDYGYRIDNFVDGNTVQQIYMALRERAIVATMPPKKQYMRFMITDKILSEIMKLFPDPRDIMAKFMSGEHKELGRNMLDGVEVQGIEATMLGVFKGRMWVDIATEYPVRVEMETQKDTEKIFIVVDGFEWNAKLAPDIFEPNIPADFTTLGEVKIGGRDEADAIEGLRMFAEVTDGNYPGSMDMTAMMQEAQETLRKKMNLAPNVEPNAEEANQITQKMTTIRETFVFYNDLVRRGKAPAYYGRDVTAGDANAILMRWKATHGSIAFTRDFTGRASSIDDFIKVEETPSSDYRVLFGNLTVVNVTEEQLKEMERAAQQ